MIKYIDKGTARQHLTDRLMESALNNAGIKADADEVFRDIAENRLPVWMDELQTADVQEVVKEWCDERNCIIVAREDFPRLEVRHGRWEYVKKRLARGGYVDASECSVCHKIIMPHLKPNYCPNCGSRMDLEGDAE